MKFSEASSFVSRLRGYMFTQLDRADRAILLKNCRAVHTCFMFFDLSLYALDKDGIVIAVEHQLKPWRFRFYGGAAHIIEVPSNHREKLGFQGIWQGSKLNVDI